MFTRIRNLSRLIAVVLAPLTLMLALGPATEAAATTPATTVVHTAQDLVSAYSPTTMAQLPADTPADLAANVGAISPLQAAAFSALVPTDGTPDLRSLTAIAGQILVVDTYKGQDSAMMVGHLLDPQTGYASLLFASTSSRNSSGQMSANAESNGRYASLAPDSPQVFCGNCAVLGLAANLAGSVFCLALASTVVALPVALLCEAIVIIVTTDVGLLCSGGQAGCQNPVVSMDPPYCPGFYNCKFRFHVYDGGHSIVSNNLTLAWRNQTIYPYIYQQSYTMFGPEAGNFSGVSRPAPNLSDFEVDAYGADRRMTGCANTVGFAASFSLNGYGVMVVGDQSPTLAKAVSAFDRCTG